MGVFTGTEYVDRAAKAAFALAACETQVILPSLRLRWNLEVTSWNFNYGVGLDASAMVVIRAGPPGDNDLVWLGSAANHAASLSGLRLGFHTYASTRFVSAVTWYQRNDNGTPVWELAPGRDYYRSSSRLLDIATL
jgi:class 3 adenylate cyclase